MANNKLPNEFNKDLRLTKSYLIKIAASATLSRIYLLISAMVLALSASIWTVFGSMLHNSNSDQLINSYLFRNIDTLQNALLPEAHTFLIKWPLYFLVNLLGAKPSTLIIITLVSVFLTLTSLMLILRRIEPRPVILGTLFLLLASCLLLIPAVPAPGNLLPLNMAMLATRNLEYIVYILGLMLFISHLRLRDWHFWLGVLLLSILAASDKLFLSMSLGGALIALVVYSLNSGWNMVSLSVRWLVGSLASGLGGAAILLLIDSQKVTHIVKGASLGPYNLTTDSHQLLLGIFYGVINIVTNFGANPAASVTVASSMPGAAIDHMASFLGLALLINFLFLAFCAYSAVKILFVSLKHNKDKEVVLDGPSKLSTALSWSALATFGLFFTTNHYFAADGRYLTIFLFAGVIAGAAYIRFTQWQAWKIVLIGIVTFLGITTSVPSVIASYNESQNALRPQKDRNALVVEAINKHKVDILVGDYWRVVPVKFNSRQNLNILPLEGCTQPKLSLNRTDWSNSLKNRSFAYLLSLDGSQTDFPRCSLDQIVEKYGRPNSSIVLQGNLSDPKEMLLFYDQGANNSAPVTPAPPQGTATVVPTTLDELPYRVCTVPTIVNVVAHQDDDLLFMNPDLVNDIKAGHCVRTIYITAGDAGSGKFYWLGRQQGTESAYSLMLGQEDIWVERVVKVGENQFVTIANPRGNPKVSLVFMYLPDGNLKGQGFQSTKFQSLAKLDSSQIQQIDAVYSDSTYTRDQLTATLAAFMHLYIPTEIRTQSTASGSHYPDHSDHMAVGRLTQSAHTAFVQKQFEGKVSIPITYYLGYTGHESPQNVTGEDLSTKEAAFNEYSKYDGGVCRSIKQCRRDPAYGAYLTRQYRHPN